MLLRTNICRASLTSIIAKVYRRAAGRPKPLYKIVPVFCRVFGTRRLLVGISLGCSRPLTGQMSGSRTMHVSKFHHVHLCTTNYAQNRRMYMIYRTSHRSTWGTIRASRMWTMAPDFRFRRNSHKQYTGGRSYVARCYSRNNRGADVLTSLHFLMRV